MAGRTILIRGERLTYAQIRALKKAEKQEFLPNARTWRSLQNRGLLTVVDDELTLTDFGRRWLETFRDRYCCDTCGDPLPEKHSRVLGLVDRVAMRFCSEECQKTWTGESE